MKRPWILIVGIAYVAISAVAIRFMKPPERIFFTVKNETSGALRVYLVDHDEKKTMVRRLAPDDSAKVSIFKGVQPRDKPPIYITAFDDGGSKVAERSIPPQEEAGHTPIPELAIKR